MRAKGQVTGALLVAAVLATAGCAGQGLAERGPASDVAAAFRRDVGADPGAACALLAPHTRETFEEQHGPCAQAMTPDAVRGTGAAPHADVYGKDARVVLADDTVFLARFTDGWRVTAAGCTEQPGLPYECAVEGS